MQNTEQNAVSGPAVERTQTELRPVYEQARGFLAQGWTQNASARDSIGHSTEPDDQDAVCWCIGGAIDRALMDVDQFWPIRTAAFDGIAKLLPSSQYGVSGWNDATGRTQAEVLAVLDQAIANA